MGPDDVNKIALRCCLEPNSEGIGGVGTYWDGVRLRFKAPTTQVGVLLDNLGMGDPMCKVCRQIITQEEYKAKKCPRCSKQCGKKIWPILLGPGYKATFYAGWVRSLRSIDRCNLDDLKKLCDGNKDNARIIMYFCPECVGKGPRSSRLARSRRPYGTDRGGSAQPRVIHFRDLELFC